MRKEKTRVFLTLIVCILLSLTSNSSFAQNLSLNSPNKTCKRVGEQVKNSAGYLECREQAKKKRVWVQLSKKPKPPKTAGGSQSINICQIPDQRATKLQPHSIAFPPSNQFIPAAGTITVALVPIDFSSQRGYSTPKKITKEMIQKIDAWTKLYTNNSLKYSYRTYDKWIRSTLPNGDRLDVGNAAKFIADSDPFINYAGVQYIYFIFPDYSNVIYEGLYGINRNFQTNEGSIFVSYYSDSILDRQFSPYRWSLFLHEIMHPQGLAGHAPANGSPFHIMANQAGPSFNPSAWDAFILGWYGEAQIYCVDASQVNKNSVVLSPIDRKEKGIKAVVIKISNNEVLVIESRRSEGFNKDLSKKVTGVMTYAVNSTQDNQRCDACGPEQLNSDLYFAKYLNVDSARHGIYRVNASPPSNLNWVMYQGEELTYKGLKIKLIKSADHDQILIERL